MDLMDIAEHSGVPADGVPLPPDLEAALAALAIAPRDEAGLRRELERHLPGYTLCRLTPAAARRWKARYRMMYGATYLDCQSAAEAYARALVAVLSAADESARMGPP